jgi:MFS family permease
MMADGQVGSGDVNAKKDWVVSRVPFFYGWLMLPVVMITMVAASPGQTFGVSVFNPYIRQALSLSHTEISSAYMLGTFLASLPMIYVGALMDRYGLRRTLTGVVILFGCACLGISQASGLTSIFFSFLFLRMLGQGAMELLANNTLAMWFHTRLGFAAGLVSVTGGLIMGLVPTFHLWLIQLLTWRWAYAFLGLIVWAAMLPLLGIFFRNRPEEIGQKVDGGLREGRRDDGGANVEERSFSLSQAIKTRAYWIMAMSMALPSMIVTGMHFHVVQIYLDSGLTEADAATMFTISAVSYAIFMFCGGLLADRLPLNILLAFAMAGLSGTILTLLHMSSLWTSQIFAGVMGIGQGTLSAVGATLWVRYYGRAHLGKIRGSLATVGVAASSTGPFLMGAGHDYFGGYHEVLWVFAALTIPMVFVGLFATPPKLEQPS